MPAARAGHAGGVGGAGGVVATVVGTSVGSAVDVDPTSVLDEVGDGGAVVSELHAAVMTRTAEAPS
jgi:hypothetical protein